MKTGLVIGAGSGIGLACLQQLTQSNAYERVFALSRHATSAVDNKVTWLEADVTDEGGVNAAVAEIASTQRRLHTLLITTGFLHDADQMPEKSLRAVETQGLERAFAVNAVAPLVCLKALAPLLTHGERSVACVLSAKVGSIGDNRSGGWFAYRMSKAALNMGIKTAAIELGRRATSPLLIAVHPGTTRTTLSAPYLARGKHPFASSAETARRIVQLVDTVTANDHGAFLHWDGTRLEW